MQQTENLELNKFDSTDLLEATTRVGLNDNFDILDNAFSGITASIGTVEGEISTLQNTKADTAAVATALSTKANIDGYYETLTAGNSLQLLSDISVTDKVPYLFRTAGGSLNIGNRETDKIVGGTVNFNQLFPYKSNTYTATDFSVQGNNDGSFTITVTAETATNDNNNHTNINTDFQTGHKYFLHSDNPLISFRLKGYGKNSETIFEPASASSFQNISFYFTDLPQGTYTVKPQIFDLTATLGTTIADYIYTLEQGTAGAGVAWATKHFPFLAKYNPYNAGTLMSVKTTAHKTVGFNAYNNGSAKVVGGHEYQITGTYSTLSLDGTTITPDASGIFTPSASGTLTVTGGGDDTCVHLVWDGERNGEYEEYKEHTYPLDDVELRGIPKLDASNNLYYDGDTYESDGTVTRKYGIVDLGSLTWDKSNITKDGQTVVVFRSGANEISAPKRADGICAEIEVIPNSVGYYPTQDYIIAHDKTCTINTNIWSGTQLRIAIRDDAYTDADTFKTAMNGVYLVYELATPTTETADPYTNPQIVDDWGTEEYIDERTISIPVGHETQYPANLKAKLETLPDSPNGNGLYGLKQTSGVNSWELLTKELPSAPLTDGNYILKCTVSGGTPTLTWEEQV